MDPSTALRSAQDDKRGGSPLRMTRGRKPAHNDKRGGSLLRMTRGEVLAMTEGSVCNDRGRRLQ